MQHLQVTLENSANLKWADSGHTHGLSDMGNVSYNKRNAHPASECSGRSRFTSQTLWRVPKVQLHSVFLLSSAISIFYQQFPCSLTPIYYRKEIKCIQNNITAYLDSVLFQIFHEERKLSFPTHWEQPNYAAIVITLNHIIMVLMATKSSERTLLNHTPVFKGISESTWRISEWAWSALVIIQCHSGMFTKGSLQCWFGSSALPYCLTV